MLRYQEAGAAATNIYSHCRTHCRTHTQAECVSTQAKLREAIQQEKRAKVRGCFLVTKTTVYRRSHHQVCTTNQETLSRLASQAAQLRTNSVGVTQRVAAVAQKAAAAAGVAAASSNGRGGGRGRGRRRGGGTTGRRRASAADYF